MANKPFDEEVINIRERPLSTDINMVSSYSPMALMELIAQLCAGRSGISTDAATPMVPVGKARFLGTGFKPRTVGGMSITLDAGLGFFNDNTSSLNIGGVSGLNWPSVFKPLSLTAAEAISVPAADPTNPRIDIIEVAVSAATVRRLADLSSRDVLDPTSGLFLPSSVNKTLTYNLNGTSTVNGAGPINYKTGTPAGVPVAPATDAGYVKIGEVLVGAAVGAIAANVIKDLRGMLLRDGCMRVSGRVSNSASVFNSLCAPPGVEATFIYQRSNAYQYSVFLKAGDASLFQALDAEVNFLNNSGTPHAWIPATVTPTFATVDATLQGQLAAGTPAMAAAVGQVVLEFDWQSWNTQGGGGLLSAADTANFNFNIGYLG